MGYYTRYSLEVTTPNRFATTDDEVIIADLRENNDCAKFAINESGDSEESCKWYDHEKDLLKFSKNYPHTLFKLSGEGEEPGDIWNKFFLNGKVQVCKARIIIDPYDPKKLQ